MPGGLSDIKPIDDNVNGIVLPLRSQIEEKAGVKGSKFEPHSYASQVVAGANYFVKIVGDEGAILARIYRDLSGNTSVSNAKAIAASDDIHYFE